MIVIVFSSMTFTVKNASYLRTKGLAISGEQRYRFDEIQQSDCPRKQNHLENSENELLLGRSNNGFLWGDNTLFGM
jgi:hypothetical protein